jgi:K+-sensing histidine kinase KdpD
MLQDKQFISVKLSAPKLKKRNRALSHLIEMSNFLATPMELEDLLKGALSMVLEYFSLKFGRIYLMDEGEAFLYLAAHQGIEITGLEKVHISEGFTGKAARTRSFVAQYVSQLKDKKRAAFLADKGLLIDICVPLISRNRVGGVMNLASSEAIHLDQGKIDLLTAVGNQIAVAANNARLYSDLKNNIDMLKEKQDMIEFFTYSMAHDLKSPAIGVHGLTRLLQKKYGEQLDEKGRTYCRQILKTSEQMVMLVEKLNFFIAAKEAPMIFESVVTSEIMEEIQQEFSTALKKKRVVWSQAENLPVIVADRMALLRVFRNFVENALKYGGETLQNIRIEYGEDPHFHVFSFSDDGGGIREKDRKKIFDRFQRNGSSKGISGSGLGLAIVREVAERHNGKAWADPHGTRGATFHLAIAKNLTITD